MALVDFIDTIAPPWAKAPSRRHWWGMFRLAAVLVDSLVEGIYQGRKAGIPGAVDLPGEAAYGGFEDVKSLEMIGRDRGVYQGLTESPPDYAYRLRHYLNAPGGWGGAGLVTGVLEQLAGVLGPTPPLMRIVSRFGDWWTRYQNGDYELMRHAGTDGFRWYASGAPRTRITTVAHDWDWDSVTIPPPPSKGNPGDWWLILYPPINMPYGTITDGTFVDPGLVGDAWNDPTTVVPSPSPWAGTVGSNAPIVLVDLVRSVIGQRQVAGWNCQFVIIAFDPDSFAPDGSSSVYPDGHWGYHSKYDSGTQSRIPARLGTAEYWGGPVGGRV